jgi:hypothetical protein
MIRLTVLYNLPPGADEDEFLRWRLTDHQAANTSTPGILRTDFGLIEAAWPAGAPSPYRFMTIVDWPDRETFERAFYAPEMQASLRENLKKIADPVFLISEILISS